MSAASNGVALREGSGSGSIGACVLLAGSLKPSLLTGACGLSVLDLLVGPATTLLEHWIRCLGPLVNGHPHAGIRVIHCEGTPPPARPTSDASVPLSIQLDRQHYRGPAGVARDTCEDLPPDTDVIVAEGARLLACDPALFAADHARSGAHITVATNPDGSPAGIYIARRSTLDIVPQRGFMDLKEQWLSRAVGQGLSVRVFSLPAPGAAALRTRGQFLRACFSFPRRAPAFHWQALGFTRGVLVRGQADNIVSSGAAVDPNALLAHTIVMPGARVAAGAVVARSILCPGARVAAGEEVVDAVVDANGVHFDNEELSRGSKERAR